MELEHRHAEIGDVRLHYAVAGNSEPVVLLHAGLKLGTPGATLSPYLQINTA